MAELNPDTPYRGRPCVTIEELLQWMFQQNETILIVRREPIHRCVEIRICTGNGMDDESKTVAVRIIERDIELQRGPSLQNYVNRMIDQFEFEKRGERLP